MQSEPLLLHVSVHHLLHKLHHEADGSSRHTVSMQYELQNALASPGWAPLLCCGNGQLLLVTETSCKGNYSRVQLKGAASTQPFSARQKRQQHTSSKPDRCKRNLHHPSRNSCVFALGTTYRGVSLDFLDRLPKLRAAHRHSQVAKPTFIVEIDLWAMLRPSKHHCIRNLAASSMRAYRAFPCIPAPPGPSAPSTQSLARCRLCPGSSCRCHATSPSAPAGRSYKQRQQQQQQCGPFKVSKQGRVSDNTLQHISNGVPRILHRLYAYAG